MGSFSIWHWLIVLVVVLLIFGTRRLRDAGADLGGAVRGFKDGLAAGEQEGSGHRAGGTDADERVTPVSPR